MKQNSAPICFRFPVVACSDTVFLTWPFSICHAETSAEMPVIEEGGVP
jgi:hypothetical protein